MSKQSVATAAPHLTQATPEQKQGVLDLIEQAEQQMSDLSLNVAAKEDKAELQAAAGGAGVPTSDDTSASEREELEMMGFDDDFFLCDEEIEDNDGDINALPATPDPTKAVPNSSAQPEVDPDEFFGDEDINA
jgi:hypothetical protein